MGLYARFLFPSVLDWTTSAPAMAQCRDAVLAHAAGALLEIGFGTGRNLAHYPAGVRRLTAIDVNPGMSRLALRRIRASGIEVDHRVANAEALLFDDRVFDTVVSTWTLCSIPDVAGALGEIRRVLKPGGRFLFVEHGRSDEPDVRRWQDRLVPVFKCLGDGCHPNRDIQAIVESAGLEIVQLERFYLQGVPRVGGYTYQGMALNPHRATTPTTAAPDEHEPGAGSLRPNRAG